MSVFNHFKVYLLYRSPLVYVYILHWLLAQNNHVQSEQFLPSSVGTKFVFSFLPGSNGTLYVGTKAVGRVQYNVSCVNKCSRSFSSTGTFGFPEFKEFHFNATNINTSLSGRHLEVFLLITSKPVSVDLIIVFFSMSSGIAGTSLLPVERAAREYFFLTSDHKGKLMVFSLDFTETVIEVFVKDNEAYKRSRESTFATGVNRSHSNPRFQFKPSSVSQRPSANKWARVRLDRYQCYYLAVTEMNSDLSGAQIKSDNPVLMVQGAEGHTGSASEADGILLDTASPPETYGTFFVVVFCALTSQVGQVKLLTKHDLNEIHIQMGQETKSVILFSKSDWFYFTVDSPGPVFLFGPDPFVVLQTIRGGEGSGGTGLCMRSVTPVDSWSTYFFWSNTFRKDDDELDQANKLHHYATVVLEAGGGLENKLRLDGEKIPEEEWRESVSEVGTKKRYSHACVRLSSTGHEAYIEGAPRARFYLSLSSFSSASYVCFNPYSNLHARNTHNGECFETIARAGDQVDNDCDDKVDEEVRNNLDDDRDGYVDEDLQMDRRVNGQWGQWSVVECVAPCNKSIGNFVRRRKCDNPPLDGSGDPCVGEEQIVHRQQCKDPVVICKDECPQKTWGVNCNKTCNQQCPGGCEKYTGACRGCPDGFTSDLCNETCPRNCRTCDQAGLCQRCAAGLSNEPFCNQTCPKTLYGLDCLLNCSDNCMYGECHSESGDCLRCKAGKWGHACQLLCVYYCSRCQRRNGTCDVTSGLLRLVGFSVVVMLLSLVLLAFLLQMDGLSNSNKNDEILQDESAATSSDDEKWKPSSDLESAMDLSIRDKDGSTKID